MSLYGGIKFSIGEQAESGLASAGSGTAALAAKVQPIDEPGPTPEVPNSTPTASTVPEKTAKVSGQASAALKFAPRIPKPKPAPSRPPPSATSSASGLMYNGQGQDEVSEGSGSGANTETRTYKPDIVRSAEPQLFGVSAGGPMREDVIVLGLDGRPLARAPAMTLNAGKKGKAKGKYGSRGRDQQNTEGKKRKKKKKRRVQVPIIPTFDPEEQYDPYKPNDLGEYQYYRKKLREERRAQLIEDRRRKDAGESSEGSSYYTDSSEEEAPRRDAPKMFAPPKQYSPPPSSRPRSPSPPPSVPPPPPPPAPRPSAPFETGDDAYARRAAMANASNAVTGDDAYAKRLAMSNSAVTKTPSGPPAPPVPASGDDAYARRVAMSQAASGDDAYARRLAMSQSVSGSNAFVPPPTHLAANAPNIPPSSGSSIPGFGSFNLPPSQAGSSIAVPPSAQPAGSSVAPSDEFATMLEERKRAAQAIAARLQALAAENPPAPAAVPTPSVVEDTSGTFAEKMFRKWGHVEGTGLGARGDGMVHALAAEHVEAAPKPADPSQPLSKRQIAKQKAAAANAKNKNRKWVQHATSRGRIVNTNEDERAKEEQARLGEASRIICLVGCVESIDDVDEELSEEIGEEASKYGIVERVVLHMVEPPPEDPRDCLRIFIVFSGMAGAWRATKELDGRFFAGGKIRATYFDESKFDAGDRDGPLV